MDNIQRMFARQGMRGGPGGQGQCSKPHSVDVLPSLPRYTATEPLPHSFAAVPSLCVSAPPIDQSVADTSETTHISSLALLKMLKHGRAGVPMEVMGLMLGEFIDEYTVQVVDVFAMPQSGTGVSVEAVDPVFQTRMLDMLRQTNRPQMVVGWYHSHPGFGCWLSGVDINVSAAHPPRTRHNRYRPIAPWRAALTRLCHAACLCLCV